MMNWLRRWWDARALRRHLQPNPRPEVKAKPSRRAMWQRLTALAGPAKASPPVVQPKPYEPPRSVVPEGVTMAMDWDGNLSDYAGQFEAIGTWAGAAFPGYPYLARLQQRPENRRMLSTIAEEMTRKWIRLTSKGDDDKTDRLDELTGAIKEFKVRDIFRTLAVQDGGFGRAQLFLHVKTPGGGDPSPAELMKPLIIAPEKITKGSLVALRTVEPMWTYPAKYGTVNPLAEDFYVPQAWYVMAREIHASRLLTIVSNPVPDLLKSSFNFSGISLVQLAEPYVDNWLRTRDSVSDMVHSFSTTGLATDLASVLTEGDDGGELMDRLDMFNRFRDNRGLMVTNKDSEEFFQFNTPLSGLEKLQAQAQEQMATPAAIPLIKFFGITPSGLNATAEPEIRVWYDHIHAKQEDDWREPLGTVLHVLMLHLWGEIDEDIDFEFLPLWEPSAVEAATIRKTDADTGAVLIASGAITADEERERLIADPDNAYHGLESNAAALSIEDETLARQEERDAALNPPGNDDGDEPPKSDD